MGFIDGAKSFAASFKNFLIMIKNFFTGIFDVFKGIFSFIKETIDFIYKMFFILFFCVLGYAGYLVFTSASNINKKIDELQTSISYIKQVSDDLSKVTQKMSSVGSKMETASEKKRQDKSTSSFTQKIKKIF